MNFLVGKILELSSKESEPPTDVVDLGNEKAGGYEVSELTNGKPNAYAKVSKINGLAQFPSSEDDHSKTPKTGSCCSA